MSRRAAWGIAAVAAYVLAVIVSTRMGLVPTLPLYDGLAPPVPYNWVDPPPELADENTRARSGRGTVGFTPEGSQARAVATDDGQCQIIFQLGSFEQRATETEISVLIAPLDPGRLPEPEGSLVIDGNAYEITATYTDSEQPARLVKDATIVLRYPSHATVVLRHDDGSGYTELEADAAPQSMQLFTDTATLGTFVAAGVPLDEDGIPVWVPVVAGLLVLAAGVEGWRYRRRRSAPASRAERRRRLDGR